MVNTRMSVKKNRNVNNQDLGWVNFLKVVYFNMALSLCVSGITAYFISQSTTLMYNIFGTKLIWIFIFLPLVLIFWLRANINNISYTGLRIFLLVFSIADSITLAPIFHIYTGESIFSVFLIASGTFLGMSLYGHLTKTDLSKLGSLCIMAVWGLIITAIINIFVMNSTLFFISSIVGVLAFTGLIAYDTHKMKNAYLSAKGEEGKVALISALNLYIDFVNLFIYLLRLFGKRKD